MTQVVAVVFTAATFAFVALHLAPGDYASALSESAPPEARAHLRERFGLDQPVLTQYVRWIRALMQGDLGVSFTEQRPVADVLVSRLPTTLILVLPAVVLAALIGMAVGSWQAAWAGRRRDRATSLLLLVVYSVPEFWLALALVIIFARWLHLTPTGGVTDSMYDQLTVRGRILDRLSHLVLPVTTLGLVGVASFARYQRASLATTLGQPFVQTARAGGLPRARVLFTAWRASLLPVVTVGGLLLPAYLAGVVFIEQVFAWPGVGSMIVDATTRRDYPLVMGAVVVGSAITAIASALAELLREAVDPRVRDRVDSTTAPRGPTA